MPRPRTTEMLLAGMTRGFHRALLSRRGPTRLLLLAVVVGATMALFASGVAGFPATRARWLAVDRVVSVASRGRGAVLTSPKLHTRDSHDLVLAFVFAAGPRSGGQRVRRLSGDGLRWSLVSRSLGTNGTAEVWQAHATRRLKGSIAVALRYAAYPAGLTVAAFGGSSPYLEAHAAVQGHASAPTAKLKHVKGSLLWGVGYSSDQKSAIAPVAGQHLVFQLFDRASRVAGWVQQATARSRAIARVGDRRPSGRWDFVSVAIASPNLARAAADRSQIAEALEGAGSGLGCTPRRAFEVGVEDDPVFLGHQPAMSPGEGFALAGSVLGARLLRLNVIRGQVQTYGWAPYDQAVQMARARGWTVEMTLMPTPTYMESSFGDALSTRHLDLGVLASFASEAATRYAGRVQRYAIGNEPNERTAFLAPARSEAARMAAYDQMYAVGYEAVKSANPTAQVLAGEIAVGGSSLFEWLENADRLPSDGIAIHDYPFPNIIGRLTGMLGHRLLVNEAGEHASNPNQLANDLQREALARCGGATGIVFYQLSREDSEESGWDTGIQ